MAVGPSNVGRGLGLYGRKPPAGSTGVVLDGFAIVGQVTERKDRLALSGVGGSLTRSRIANLFLQHHKTGIWVDGPASELTISNVRMADLMADGINLSGGVTDSRIAGNFIRGSGDDGIALWSRRAADRRVTIAANTVVAPSLANGVAVYGGADIAVSGNLVADTLTEGGGIHLGNRFGAVPHAA